MPITLPNGKTIIDIGNLSELFLNPNASKTKATPGLVSGPIPEELLNNPNAAMIEIPDSNVQPILMNKLPSLPTKGLMIGGGPIRPILLGDPQLSPKCNEDKEDSSQTSEKEDYQESPFAPRRPEAKLQLGLTVNKDFQLPGTPSQLPETPSQTPVEDSKAISLRHKAKQKQQPEHRVQEEKQRKHVGLAQKAEQVQIQPQKQQARCITGSDIPGYSQMPIPARVVAEKPRARLSPQETKRGESKQRSDTHFAVGALTMLCKATTQPRQSSSWEYNRPNLPPCREQRRQPQQQQLRKDQQRDDQQRDYAPRKRRYSVTLSEAPIISHVPSRKVFRPREDSIHSRSPSMTQPQEAHVVQVNANTPSYPQQGMGVAKKMRTQSVSGGFGQSLSKKDDYFSGVVSSHSGTRKMNSLGIPTMLVRLPQPQMHLMGFVVAGHIAWQAIANSTDQNNWTIARCLMCIRHPSALELMICDPTPIHPAIQHVYICPSHCVRRFIPNIPNLREQLNKDVISLPLSRPAPPNPFGTASLGQSSLTPLPPVETASQARMPFLSFPQGRHQLKSLPNFMFMQRSETKKHICKMCNKEFSCKSSLNRHMRIHSGIKPYQCNTCGKKFADKGVLDVHERIHTGMKPYQCTECNKVFSQKGNLKRHMRIHSGDRPYKCNLCNKCFSQKGHLTAHLRIHTGQKPYICEYCNKSFTQSSTLIGHKRTHTGERPHRCNICNKTFRQKGNLTAHMVMHQMHEDNESRLSMAPVLPETSSFSRQLHR